MGMPSKQVFDDKDNISSPLAIQLFSISIIVKSAGEPFKILPASKLRIFDGPRVKSLIAVFIEILFDFKLNT